MINAKGSEHGSETAAVVMPKVPVTLDSKGRVRTSKEQRSVILDEFERSGETGAAFAKRTGLKYSTLAGWLARDRRAKPERRQPLRLWEAVVESAPKAGAGVLVLQLPGGVRVEVIDEKQVASAAALIRALAKPC